MKKDRGKVGVNIGKSDGKATKELVRTKIDETVGTEEGTPLGLRENK